MSESKVTDLSSAPAAPKVESRALDKKPAAAKVVKGANHDVALSGKTQLINIHADKEEGGADAVFVSLNGYAYQIPRGTPQRVPVEVVEILSNAQSTLLQTDKAGGVAERVVPRYAYSVLTAPESVVAEAA